MRGTKAKSIRRAVRRMYRDVKETIYKRQPSGSVYLDETCGRWLYLVFKKSAKQER